MAWIKNDFVAAGLIGTFYCDNCYYRINHYGKYFLLGYRDLFSKVI